MTEGEALKIIEGMSRRDFNKFLNALPQRVKSLVRSGLADWRAVLPAWYIKMQSGEIDALLNPEDIPF